MKELDIKIWNEKNVVLMEVLQQDKSLRGKGLFLKASNGFTIGSWNYPILYNDGISVKGDCEEDSNKMCCKDCYIAKRAKEYVLKVQEAVEEYNETIIEVLDAKEKEFLRTIIKPFEDRVRYISKETSQVGEQHIFIMLDNDSITLPVFKSGTMYRRMKLGKEYTLGKLKL